MTDIADAIRSKDGSSAKMLPSEMAGKIQNIPEGEQRLICKNITVSANTSSKVVKGKGYLALANTNNLDKVRIDGKAVSNIFITYKDGTEFENYNPNYFKLKFETSCTLPGTNYESSSRRSQNIAVTGEYTNVTLDGNPSLVYIGLEQIQGITIQGKGYAIISGSGGQYGNSSLPASILIDGTSVTSASSVIREIPIRIDFNESFYVPVSSNSFYITVYVWN